VLQLHQISKVFPHGEPIKNVSWELKAGDRVGIVGPNGAGKTTLFKIITGQIEPTTGHITRSPGLKIAYLSQEFDVVPTHTLHDELLRAFKEANDCHERLHEVQMAMETATPEETNKLLKEMDKLQHLFDTLGGYDLHVRIDKLLPTIGFKPDDADRLVSTFSGGWQMRIALGKVMLQEPDLILLDEPTNHIDLETIEWLETYIKTLSCPVALISHDRMFMDRLCNKIIEIERGVASEYLGNYTAYIEQREFNRQAQQAAFERQQREMERQQEFVDRFRASATRSTQAKSREKQLDKIEIIDAPESDLRTLSFKFPPCQRSGREVVTIKNLMHSYDDDNILFCDANLLIERGDRIALLGANGCGKSTLLRFIVGEEAPVSGVVKMGEHNIVPAYFAQNQAEALDLDKTVLATIADLVPDWKDAEIRSLLGRFLFGGDNVFKQVRTLSGGEKARLALAKMLLRSANFLILDEPTNHLDIPAKETLEDALKQHDGAVVIVSHDRYFISQVATKIVEIRDGNMRVFAGDYNYYQEKIAQEREAAQVAKEEAEREAQLAEKRAKQREKDRQKELSRKQARA
jgi:ATP-binding cassette subfamily F protein 3